ncbi:MAG TPA: hypothetical protein VMF88_05485 [Bacteroidota bacterium]|nr:hypothetical protein [Bacteroidota bacterium]
MIVIEKNGVFLVSDIPSERMGRMRWLLKIVCQFESNMRGQASVVSQFSPSISFEEARLLEYDKYDSAIGGDQSTLEGLIAQTGEKV